MQGQQTVPELACGNIVYYLTQSLVHLPFDIPSYTTEIGKLETIFALLSCS